MATVILDADLARQLREQRVACGGDRYDEVWEGTYMMAPLANNEHQELISKLSRVLEEVVGDSSLGSVFPGCNVSDRQEDWTENFRVPDVAVFLNGTNAVDRGSYWQGGPDFAIEVVSPGDQCREKLDFYATVETRELLIVDRDPWQLERYRLSAGTLPLIETVRATESKPIRSEVTGLTFEFQSGPSRGRPSLLVTDPASSRSWTI